MNELTHLDLFSGIGGFALAAKWTGFRTVGFSEVEPYACRVLAERFPAVPNIGDVQKRSNFARFRGCTVLTGGFPCQPWSEAGQRRGKDDHRHLWPAMCEVVETVWPTWIVGENVDGIISLGLEDVCADLESRNYSTQSFVIPAVAAGAPHLRERVWILAHANGGRWRANASAGHHANGDDANGTKADREPIAGGAFGGAQNLADPNGLRGVEPQGRVCDVGGWYRHGSWWLRLGNAIVPQIAAEILSFIAAIECGQKTI